MILWKKIWYYGQIQGTIMRALERFTNIKNIEDYKKLRSYGNIPKQLLLLLQNFDLLFKTMVHVLWKKKLWYYGKNYGTMDKICYYTENYGTLIYYGKNYGTLKNYGITVNYR